MAYYKQEVQKKMVFIIPSLSEKNQVCDFVSQTAQTLNKSNYVYVVNLSVNQSIFSILKKWLQDQTFDLRVPIYFLPLRRFSIIRKINLDLYFVFLQLYLTFKHRGAKYYWWYFFPQLAFLLKIKLPQWRVIVDLVDYHTGPDLEKQKALDVNKKFLLHKADHIFAISRTLQQLYQGYTRTKINIVPQGFGVSSNVKTGLHRDVLLPQGKKIIGFVGQVSERLDFALLAKLIAANPELNFVFVGPFHHESNLPKKDIKKEFKRLQRFSNCFHYGRQTRANIANIISQFDLCIIPYDSQFPFNRYAYPMKLFEYFYAGKPILSTKIIELERFSDLVRMGETADQWQQHIQQLLQHR